MLRLLPRGEKCRQAMRGIAKAFIGKAPIGENLDIAQDIPLIRPSGQVAEVIVKAMVDRNLLRYRLFAGCMNVVGLRPENPETSENRVASLAHWMLGPGPEA